MICRPCSRAGDLNKWITEQEHTFENSNEKIYWINQVEEDHSRCTSTSCTCEHHTGSGHYRLGHEVEGNN